MVAPLWKKRHEIKTENVKRTHTTLKFLEKVPSDFFATVLIMKTLTIIVTLFNLNFKESIVIYWVKFFKLLWTSPGLICKKISS